MSLIIPPGFAAVSIPIRNFAVTRAAAITFGIEVPGSPVPDELAAEVQSIFAATVGSRMDASCSIGNTRVAIGQDGGEPVLGFAPASTPGGRALDATAPALAVLIQKRTARGGRRGRGNLYLPWACADNTVTEAGILATTEVNGYNTELNNWRTNMASESMNLTLLHSEGITAPGDPNEITSMQVSPVISHQVRRQTR